MDIEGEEWNWIRSFKDSFMKVKQFVFEAHAIYLNGPDYAVKGKVTPDIEWLKYILKSLQILNETHHLVHVHQNVSSCPVIFNGVSYPTFFELTFIRKDCKINGLNKNDLPIKNLDFPCGLDPMPEDMIDKNMSFYPFKF